jgi:hypothetical protein
MILRTSQIGRCGELLVQYRLLKHGIESAPMTTDDGIDLVVYSPFLKDAVTVQVKTNHRPKPSGGKGKLALDWWLRIDSPAALVALVDLTSDRIWMFTHAELLEASQQKSGGRMHFYFYVDPSYKPRSTLLHMSDFSRFDIDKRVHEIFGFPTDLDAT